VFSTGAIFFEWVVEWADKEDKAAMGDARKRALREEGFSVASRMGTGFILGLGHVFLFFPCSANLSQGVADLSRDACIIIDADWLARTRDE
jgi:hypothetical protein